ncbi:MAG: TIGR02677 family protein [Prosthecobacter sp.]|nr:TIGR02677 family protein [Prosthecobacter sp.]
MRNLGWLYMIGSVDAQQLHTPGNEIVAESRDGEELRSVFFHLNAQKAAAYRVILRVFVAAKEGFEIALRPGEILSRIEEPEHRHAGLGGEDEIIACLDQLCLWGNLDATRDMVSARTIEEYLHPKRLFQLTHAGDMAERALAFFDKELMRPGELSTTALRDIADTLDELLRLMAAEALDEAKAVRALNDLSSRFDTLVTRAQMFIGGLQREMDKPVAEESAFIALKEELLSYLDRFVKELTSASYRIRNSLEKLDARGMEPALEAAARAELADELAPQEARRAQTLRRWQHHWSGLRGWFISSGHHTAHAESLRSRATAAIPALLERVRRMHDQRANRADRSTDFLALARWFAEAPEDEDMHRLWRAAFALNSCRHLRVNETTLQAWAALDDNERPSWEDCPPYIITIAQWTRGRVAPRGRPPGIIDRAAARAVLRERAAAESRALHAARSVLAARTPCALSELPELDDVGFEVLLDAIGEAFAMIGPADQQGEAVTADGGMSVQIHLPAPRAELARLHTAEGVLSGPDLRITLRLTEDEA